MDGHEEIEMNQAGFAESKTSKEKYTIRNKLIAIDELTKGRSKHEAWLMPHQIWKNYATAMEMKDREPLEEGRFNYHFFKEGNYDDSVVFGGEKDGLLLGSNVDGIFIPTHFAPTSLKGGYRLIKDLVKSDIPTALFITEDLKRTIKKMDGWKTIPLPINTDFRGEKVKKYMVVNKWETLPKLAKPQIKKVASKKMEIYKWRTRHKIMEIKGNMSEFASRALEKFRGNKTNLEDFESALSN